jgi:hypothetical protein
VVLEGLGKLKKSTSSGTRSGDLPACSIVPQPTTLPHVPFKQSIEGKFEPEKELTTGTHLENICKLKLRVLFNPCFVISTS